MYSSQALTAFQCHVLLAVEEVADIPHVSRVTEPHPKGGGWNAVQGDALHGVGDVLHQVNAGRGGVKEWSPAGDVVVGDHHTGDRS